MADLTPESVPYGVSRFEDLRNGGRYFVDKSEYIRKLEQRADFLFFVRPRRFGKSLFVDMLRCYYDVNKKGDFEKLFGDLAIGRNPTKGANSYQVLALDFSLVNSWLGGTLEQRFDAYMGICIDAFIHEYTAFYDPEFRHGLAAMGPAQRFKAVTAYAKAKGYPLYLIIDECDNFTNQMIRAEGNGLHESVTHCEGFFREWFKSFKESFSRIFMTGVSPVTMYDLTSGFNIATNISQEPSYNAMIGFTKEETRKIFADFKGVGRFVNDVERHLETVEKWYGGYCFSEATAGKEHVFNCTLVFYYLNYLLDNGRPPEKLVDFNIRINWNKFAMLLAVQKRAETFDGVLPLTEELADGGEVTFELADSFPIRDVADEKNFKSLYYYYGIVTMGRIFEGELMFRVPNECVRRQIFEYMRTWYARQLPAFGDGEFSRLYRRFSWHGEFEELFKYLAARFKEYGSCRDGVSAEPLVNGFFRAYLMMSERYVARPELELGGRYCDYAFFPNVMIQEELRPRHSYVIELKHAPVSAPESKLAANHAEALAQLEAYSKHPNLAALAAGTPVHFLDVEFRGRDLIRCEEVSHRTC